MKPFFVVVGVVVSFFYGGGRAVSRRCDRRRRSSVIDGNCHCLPCRLLGTVDRCERSRSPERHVRPRPQSNNRRGAPSTTIPPRRSGGIRSDGRAERVAAESPCFVFFHGALFQTDSSSTFDAAWLVLFWSFFVIGLTPPRPAPLLQGVPTSLRSS